MSYPQVHRMPVRYRRWFLERLVRHFEEKNKAIKKSSSEPLNNKDKSGEYDMFSRFEDQVKNKLT